MKTLRVPSIVVCCLFLLTAAVPDVSAVPKLLPGAKAGDCKACHGKEKVLPDGHDDTRAMLLKDCLECHRDNTALTGKLPGRHAHHLAGVNCAGCHGKTKKPEAPEMGKCVSCHGSAAALAEKTARAKVPNPHKSPHYGTDLDCNLCHHQHAKSELYCNTCHKFDFVVP